MTGGNDGRDHDGADAPGHGDAAGGRDRARTIMGHPGMFSDLQKKLRTDQSAGDSEVRAPAPAPASDAARPAAPGPPEAPSAAPAPAKPPAAASPSQPPSAARRASSQTEPTVALEGVSIADLIKAEQERQAAEAAVDPAQFAGAAPAPAPAPAPARPDSPPPSVVVDQGPPTAGPSSPSASPAGRSPLPMILGGVLVVVGILVAWFMAGGGAGAPLPAPSGGAVVPADAPGIIVVDGPAVRASWAWKALEPTISKSDAIVAMKEAIGAGPEAIGQATFALELADKQQEFVALVDGSFDGAKVQESLAAAIGRGSGEAAHDVAGVTMYGALEGRAAMVGGVTPAGRVVFGTPRMAKAAVEAAGSGAAVTERPAMAKALSALSTGGAAVWGALELTDGLLAMGAGLMQGVGGLAEAGDVVGFTVHMGGDIELAALYITDDASRAEGLVAMAGGGISVAKKMVEGLGDAYKADATAVLDAITVAQDGTHVATQVTVPRAIAEKYVLLLAELIAD